VADAKHTPGPWEADNGEGYSIWSIYGRTSLIAQAIGDSAETDANAHLIAAAPELLDALKEAIDGKVRQHSHAAHPSGLFCSVCGVNSDQAVHHPKCWVALADAAIAKAEGAK
jgi:hypothetical protein